MGYFLNYVVGGPLKEMEGKAVLFALLALAILHVPVAAQGPEKRRTGNVCSTDVQCPDNAFCKAGSYCVCKDGYVYAATENDEKECLKVGGYGDPCTQHIQCHTSLGVHAECFLNTCSCKAKTQLVNDRCYKISVVGERCMTDSNCYMSDAPPEEQAYCVRGFCTCQLHYSPRDNGTRCVRDAELGEKCVDQYQCAGVGLECRETCRCKEGFAAHNESNVCMESVEKLNDPCEYDVQCDTLSGARTPGATLCLGGVCSCGYNARAAGEPARCWYIRRPGQQCRVDQECYSEDDEPGFCRAGRCTCTGCVPDVRDFSDHSTAVTSAPLLAAILAAAAIFA